MKALLPYSKYLVLLLTLSTMSCETTADIINPETQTSSNKETPNNESTSKDVEKENDNNNQNGSEQNVSLAAKLTAAVPSGYNVKKDQSYGPSATQAYDLYTPIVSDSTKKSVSLVMVHGGGWSLLDKSFLDNVVELFKRENLNITIFNINHRLPLSDGVTFDGVMEDFNLFFEHQQTLKQQLNLSEDVVLWGYSSGGHLALTYSYKFPKPYIKSVAAVAAPTDLTQESIYKGIVDDKERNLTEKFIGVAYDSNPNAYKAASPIFDINAQSAKTILFYGQRDGLVDVDEQGRRLYNKLIANNVKASFKALPNATHDMKGEMPGIVIETIRFLKEQ
ncbi:alpha/beta hydrolase [uncultured Arcticibacterium sp.]|uniref:alpha/beta hydrolase n=1 Tax=uncultured Arcticibacterium sp. TaxID=2173042 RepID=UPI0030FAFFAF